MTGFAGFLFSLFSLAFPSLAVKMSLYPLVPGGYLHMEIYFQLSGGTEEGKSMLFSTPVSELSLIQSNHCATVECFGVSCPAPHQEHKLPGTSPSSYRELTQGLERGCQPACPVASGPFLASPALYFLGRCLSRMLLSGEELGSLSSHPFPPQTQRP